MDLDLDADIFAETLFLSVIETSALLLTFLTMGHSSKLPVYTLVLDLDETLVSVDDSHVNGYDFSFMGPSGEHYYARKRPHLDEFLAYINDNPLFRIVVWSAGLDFYVDAIVDAVFPKRPAAVYSREFCEITTNSTEVVILKSLAKLHASLALCDERAKGRHVGCDLKYFDPEYTIFIDDNPTTFSDNPANALWIKEYRGQSDDDTLLSLKAALLHLEKDPRKASQLYKPILNHAAQVNLR